jgi:cation diffusion facilitator CzcD-associated flavoprotein CzcO
MDNQHYRIAIIGTGFSGLGMGIRLKQSGVEDFVILERAGEIGGAWRDNTYPGCACDVQSHLYSFSFAPNPNWSRLYSPQSEIRQYLHNCAEQYGLKPHIRFHSPLQEAAWDETRQCWHIRLPQETITAQVLILGQGSLSDPQLPDLPGLSNFAGTLFHSSRWNHSYDLRGKRVAVIGTGASAIQFVPQIQHQVEKLVLFQRTPAWIVPRQDYAIPEWQHQLFRRLPLAQRLVRSVMYWQREIRVLGLVYKPEMVKKTEKLVKKFLEYQVADPTLRAKLTPSYSLGCKRILLSDDFYPALTQPNVDLVTEPIAEVHPHSIKSTTGEVYEVDAIICGTGFQVTTAPIMHLVRGRNGELLANTWRESMQAYLGTTVSGYPNMFMMTGPNTGLGHNSMVYMIEAQITYILDALKTMQQQQLAAVEVRADIQTVYNEQLQHKMQGTVWNSGCQSWYQDARGRITTLWPDFTFKFRNLTRKFNSADYELTARETVPAPLVAAGSTR